MMNALPRSYNFLFYSLTCDPVKDLTWIYCLERRTLYKFCFRERYLGYMKKFHAIHHKHVYVENTLVENVQIDCVLNVI